MYFYGWTSSRGYWYFHLKREIQGIEGVKYNGGKKGTNGGAGLPGTISIR